MIRNVAELLSALLSNLSREVGSEKTVRHPVVVGEMYEGIAATLIKSGTSFVGLDIQVSSGFIEDGKGNTSNWADCMVCVGAGRPVPQTNKRVYKAEDVLLIVEVKKTLTSKSLKDALLWFRDYFNRLDRAAAPRLPELVRTSWKLIMKKPFPAKDEEIDAFSGMEDTVFRRIVSEARMPARVVFGFYGYKDEAKLRSGFAHVFPKIGFLPSPPVGADINALPNLIICGNASLIKLDGFPYRGPFEEKSQTWCWYGSKTGNPLLPLLEILWTRLQSRFDLPADIFGKDLENEGLSRFVSLRFVPSERGLLGQYYFETLKTEPGQQEFAAWEPAELNCAEFCVVHALCGGGVVDMDAGAFKEMLARNCVSEDELVRGLRDKELVGVRGRRLELLTESLQCMCLSDGRMVAAENNSGRLTAYAAEYVRRKQTEPGK